MDTPCPDTILAARHVIAQALSRFPDDALAIAATGGKDSTLLVHLWREAAAAAARPMPRVLFLDEGDAFPEILAFVDRLRRDWNLPLVTARNHDLLGEGLAVGEWVETARLSGENRRELERIGFTGPGFAFDPETLPGRPLAQTVPLTRFLATPATAPPGTPHPDPPPTRPARDRQPAKGPPSRTGGCGPGCRNRPPGPRTWRATGCW